MSSKKVSVEITEVENGWTVDWRGQDEEADNPPYGYKQWVFTDGHAALVKVQELMSQDNPS